VKKKQKICVIEPLRIERQRNSLKTQQTDVNGKLQKYHNHLFINALFVTRIYEIYFFNVK
jgi:hypothetical protein